MKKIAILTISIIISTVLPAQRRIIDSSLQLLKVQIKKDTFRLNTLLNITEKFRATNLDSSLLFGEEAALLAKELNNQSKLALAYRYIALGYGLKYDYTREEEYYLKSLKIYEDLNDLAGISNIKNNMGVTFLNKAEYVKANEFILEALKFAEKANSRSHIAMANGNLGRIHQATGNYSLALNYYKNAAEEFKILNNMPMHAIALNNTGWMYYMLTESDFDQAMKYAEQTVKVCNDHNIPRTKGKALNLIASIHYYRGRMFDSWSVFTQALRTAMPVNDQVTEAVARSYMAEILTKAPPTTLDSIGMPLNNRYDSALAYQQKANEQLKQIEDYKRLAEGLENLSVIYAAQNDFRKAYETHKEFKKANDSVLNDTKKEAILKTQMQYENDKVLAVKEQEVKRQEVIRNFSIAGSILILLLTIAGFTIYQRRKETIRKIKEANLRAEISSIEIKALRAQMNPHFIFNSLNSISDFVSKSDSANATLYLGKFASLMRIILENSGKKQISLSEEIKGLELYLLLEAQRLKGKFEWEITIPTNIDPQNTAIPPLILQPFVENSIWHGISQLSGKGRIRIYFQKVDDWLLCNVEDNGVGRKRNTFSSDVNSSEKKSLGVALTKSRIQFFTSEKNIASSVHLEDLEQGLKATIKIPYSEIF